MTTETKPLPTPIRSEATLVRWRAGWPGKASLSPASTSAAVSSVPSSPEPEPTSPILQTKVLSGCED